jgi:hypothetical protein
VNATNNSTPQRTFLPRNEKWSHYRGWDKATWSWARFPLQQRQDSNKTTRNENDWVTNNIFVRRKPFFHLLFSFHRKAHEKIRDCWSGGCVNRNNTCTEKCSPIKRSSLEDVHCWAKSKEHYFSNRDLCMACHVHSKRRKVNVFPWRGSLPFSEGGVEVKIHELLNSALYNVWSPSDSCHFTEVSCYPLEVKLVRHHNCSRQHNSFLYRHEFQCAHKLCSIIINPLKS